MTRVAATAGITWLKQGAGMDVNDKRKPQFGVLKGMLDGKRHDLEVATAGSTAGESMRLHIDPKKRFDFKLETMGMTPEQLAAVVASITENRGLVLVCSPKQQGLTTMLYTILRRHDAFLSHIQTIEHGAKEDLEGVTQNRLAANVTSAEEYKQVEWVVSQQPDVIMIDEIANPESTGIWPSMPWKSVPMSACGREAPLTRWRRGGGSWATTSLRSSH